MVLFPVVRTNSIPPRSSHLKESFRCHSTPTERRTISIVHLPCLQSLACLSLMIHYVLFRVNPRLRVQIWDHWRLERYLWPSHWSDPRPAFMVLVRIRKPRSMDESHAQQSKSKTKCCLGIDDGHPGCPGAASQIR